MSAVTCPICKREFPSYRSLGQHERARRASAAKGRQSRICPDRRNDEEVREINLRISRLRARIHGRGAWS